jgi:hypothetical protein
VLDLAGRGCAWRWDERGPPRSRAGTSALFVLSDLGDVEPMRRWLGPRMVELVRADLNRDEAARLSAALGAEAGPPAL